MTKARIISYIILAATATLATFMLIASVVLTCIDLTKRDMKL